MAHRRCSVGVPVKGAFEYWSRDGGTEPTWISEIAQDLGGQRGGVKTFQVRRRRRYGVEEGMSMAEVHDTSLFLPVSKLDRLLPCNREMGIT